MLHRRGHGVTVIERDSAQAPADAAAAWEVWERRGVPQFRHFHAYSALARQTLLRELPDVYEALLDSGISETDIGARVRGLFPDTQPEDGDANLYGLRGRRTTFEWVLRRIVEGSGVDLRRGASVDGLMRSDSMIVGVVCDGMELHADLVVDATGRRTASADWLADVGFPPGPMLRREVGIVYYSRWYRARPGVDFPDNVVRLDLLSMRAVLSPADDGFASVVFSPAADDVALKALRHVSAFQAVAEKLPLIGEWTRPDRASPVSDVLFMGNLWNCHRPLADEADAAIGGLVAIGDASTVTNPYYGKGVALGVTHAAILAHVLDEVSEPSEVGPHFWRATQATMRPWFDESAHEDDLHQLWLRVARGAQLTERDANLLASDEAKAHRAVFIAMLRDAVVFRFFIRNFMCLDPPDQLHSPELVRRTLALVSDEELLAVPIGRNDLVALVASA
jgi:2-polyprenyl-6-methoxyphenol hydroxylase-like FAD-dependent oxidoreductase